MGQDGYPAVTDWYRRSEARPSVQKIFYEGSRFSNVYPDLGLGRSNVAACRRGAVGRKFLRITVENGGAVDAFDIGVGDGCSLPGRG